MSLERLVSYEVEKHCLAGLIKHPNILSQIDTFISEDSFFCGEKNEHKVIFSVVEQLILSKTKFNNVLIAQKISELNIKFAGVSPIEYLDAITQFDIDEEACVENFKQLAKLKFLRDEYMQAEQVKQAIVKQRSKPVVEIIGEIDRLKNRVTTQLFNDKDEFSNIFSTLEERIEGIAANPPKEEDLYYGPFKSINELYGPLHQPGNITMLAARSGAGKTALSSFYNIFMAEKYKIPCLHIDNAEMSEEELQARAVSSLTGGQVPLGAVLKGTWVNNPIWAESVRKVWPRVEKMKYDYFQCGDLDAMGVINGIRRYSYNIVGRDNPFFVNFDYVKPFDESNKDSPEWQRMGHFMNDVKKFIQNEINIPFWCSIQTNRHGITNNKRSADLDESENTISISDRITHYVSFLFLMRKKVMDELAFEDNQYGNIVLRNIGKERQMLGDRYFDAINPVEYEKGRYKSNYVNLRHDGFFFEDMGDFKSMVEDMKDDNEVQPDHEDDGQLV